MGTKPVVEDLPRIYAKKLIRRAKFDSAVTIRHPDAGLLAAKQPLFEHLIGAGQ